MYHSQKMDRTSFFAGTHEQLAANDILLQKELSDIDRIANLTLLSNCLYGFTKDLNPKMDKAVFSAKKFS